MAAGRALLLTPRWRALDLTGSTTPTRDNQEERRKPSEHVMSLGLPGCSLLQITKSVARLTTRTQETRQPAISRRRGHPMPGEFWMAGRRGRSAGCGLQ